MQWRFWRREALASAPPCQTIEGCHPNHFDSLRDTCSHISGLGLLPNWKLQAYSKHSTKNTSFQKWVEATKMAPSPPNKVQLPRHNTWWYIDVDSGNWLTWVWWHRTIPSGDWNVMDGRMGRMTFLLLMTAGRWWQEFPDYRRSKLNKEQSSHWNTGQLCPMSYLRSWNSSDLKAAS